MHDLVIRGGCIVDGSGGEPFNGDIAVDGNRITAVGQVDSGGRQVLDAEGRTVTPGFIDLHTHLDAQIGWDPLLTPLSSQGVTTALLGNCGVSFAPVQAHDRALLAEMMEAVEDIPAAAILEGLPWTWRDYGEYLDCLQGLGPAINVGGLIGHCALRFYVMGERAVEQQPTPDEVRRMAMLAEQACIDGAVGFSTSRLLDHTLPDGRHVPGTHALPGELLAIADALGRQRGLFQCVPNMLQLDIELPLIGDLAQASGQRVLFNIIAGNSDDSGRYITAALDAFRQRELDVTAITLPRASGVLLGLVNQMPWATAAWETLGALDFEQRLSALRDADTRDRLVREAREASSAFPLEQIFWLGTSGSGDAPDYGFQLRHNLQHIAAEGGEHPADTFLRMSLESNGRALFLARLFNDNQTALDTLLHSAHVLPSLGDTGAHVGLIMDAGWCTYLLSELVRERSFFSLAEGVRRITSAPARVMGLRDRGTLRPGAHADINVIDLPRLGLAVPDYVHDLPGAAGRFTQRASGFDYTLCNGRVILREDTCTGERAGEVVRH